MLDLFCDALAIKATFSLTSFIERWLLFTFKKLRNSSKISEKVTVSKRFKTRGNGRTIFLKRQFLLYNSFLKLILDNIRLPCACTCNSDLFHGLRLSDVCSWIMPQPTCVHLFEGYSLKTFELKTTLRINKPFKTVYAILTDPETVNLTSTLCKAVSKRFLSFTLVAVRVYLIMERLR